MLFKLNMKFIIFHLGEHKVMISNVGEEAALAFGKQLAFIRES